MRSTYYQFQSEYESVNAVLNPTGYSAVIYGRLSYKSRVDIYGTTNVYAFGRSYNLIALDYVKLHSMMSNEFRIQVT